MSNRTSMELKRILQRLHKPARAVSMSNRTSMELKHPPSHCCVNISLNGVSMSNRTSLELKQDTAVNDSEREQVSQCLIEPVWN